MTRICRLCEQRGADHLAEGAPPSSDTDARALEDGYVSVTPVSFDLTAHDFLPALTRRLSRD